jgi:hypothetical protein
MALWRAGMARLAGRNVGLDGVLAQQANYAKSGFHLAQRNIRYEGSAPAQPSATIPEHIVPLSALPFDTVSQYDRAFFADQRSGFLRAWLSQQGSTALGAIGPQGLAGYGVLRPCQQGYKLGPLFADTPALAEDLFNALLAKAPAGSPVFLDVPEPNAQACALAARHGMRACFETARMYTGERPDISLARAYGITSFELG